MKTVLIVDDEINVLYGLKRILSRLSGLQVLISNNPKEALQIAARVQVDLFLVDYRMPEIHGDEFLVFAREYHPQAIRMMLSGAADLNGLSNAINRARIHRFLSKPVSKDELMFQLSQALQENDIAQLKCQQAA